VPSGLPTPAAFEVLLDAVDGVSKTSWSRPKSAL
jgi:hypothetical protein